MHLIENYPNHVVFDIICRKSVINSLKLLSEKDKTKILKQYSSLILYYIKTIRKKIVFSSLIHTIMYVYMYIQACSRVVKMKLLDTYTRGTLCLRTMLPYVVYLTRDYNSSLSFLSFFLHSQVFSWRSPIDLLKRDPSTFPSASISIHTRRRVYLNAGRAATSTRKKICEVQVDDTRQISDRGQHAFRRRPPLNALEALF